MSEPVDLLVHCDAEPGYGTGRWLVTVVGELRARGWSIAVHHPGPAEPTPSAAIERAGPRIVLFSDSGPEANLVAKEAAHRCGIPYVTVSHASAVRRDVDLAATRDRITATLQRARVAVAVSAHTLGVLRSLTGDPLRHGVVVHNGVPEEMFVPRTRRAAVRRATGTRLEATVGVSVGRVDTAKGIVVLQRALQALGDDVELTWWWVGGGPGLRRAQAAALSPRLRLLGERTDVADLLHAADLFALPTYGDAFCLAAVEAMAAGLPVAVPAVDGLPEIVGSAAALLPDPNRDPAATAAALVATLGSWTADPSARRELGRRGRRLARRRYTAARMGDDYHRILEEVVEGR